MADDNPTLSAVPEDSVIRWVADRAMETEYTHDRPI